MINDRNNVDALKNLAVTLIGNGLMPEDIPTTTIADTISYITDNYSSAGTGEKGDKGDSGKTPVKGVDYWTESDKSEVVSETKAEVEPMIATISAMTHNASESAKNALETATMLQGIVPLIDYVDIGAGEKYYIDGPGIYLFVGPDYKLNFYTADALGNYSVVGHENNLITALFVAEKHDNDEQLQIFWGKTYKALAVATTESQNINGAWYTPQSRAPYVINTDSTNGAFLYYIKPQGDD